MLLYDVPEVDLPEVLLFTVAEDDDLEVVAAGLR